MKGHPNGERARSRPRLRWLEDEEADLRSLTKGGETWRGDT